MTPVLLQDVGPALVERQDTQHRLVLRVPEGIVVEERPRRPAPVAEPTPEAPGGVELVAVARGHGLVAALSATELFVWEGAGLRCRAPRRVPGHVLAGGAQAEALAIGPTHVAVLSHRAGEVLLYDRADCAHTASVYVEPSPRLPGGPVVPPPTGQLAALDALTWAHDEAGADLLVATSAHALYTWRGDGEDAPARGGQLVLDVLSARDGPALLTLGALVTGARWRDSLAVGLVVGEELVSLDADGLRWTDVEGDEKGRGPAGAVRTLFGADRVGEGLVVMDGEASFAFGAPPRVAAAPSREDHSDFEDGGGLPSRHGELVAGTAGGRFVLVRTPSGVEVQGQGWSWGVERRATPWVAGISPDGRVVVGVEGSRLVAWRVADGEPLWGREDTDLGRARGVRVGPDWVAVATERGWRFHDPADAHVLAELRPGGEVVDGTGRRLGWVGTVPTVALRGRPWEAAAPAARKREDDPWPLLAGAPPSTNGACAEGVRWAAALERWHDLGRRWLGGLAQGCAMGPPAALAWPPPALPVETGGLRAAPEDPGALPVALIAGATLTWSGRGTVTSLVGAPDGGVYVGWPRGVAHLDREGRLLWWRPAERRVARLAGDLLLLRQGGRVEGWEAATGRARWALSLADPGALLGEPQVEPGRPLPGRSAHGAWVRPAAGSGWRWLDLASGQLRVVGPPGAPPTPGRGARPWSAGPESSAASARPLPEPVELGGGERLVATSSTRWARVGADGVERRSWPAALAGGGGGVVWVAWRDTLFGYGSGPPATEPVAGAQVPVIAAPAVPVPKWLAPPWREGLADRARWYGGGTVFRPGTLRLLAVAGGEVVLFDSFTGQVFHHGRAPNGFGPPSPEGRPASTMEPADVAVPCEGPAIPRLSTPGRAVAISGGELRARGVDGGEWSREGVVAAWAVGESTLVVGTPNTLVVLRAETGEVRGAVALGGRLRCLGVPG